MALMRHFLSLSRNFAGFFCHFVRSQQVVEPIIGNIGSRADIEPSPEKPGPPLIGKIPSNAPVSAVLACSRILHTTFCNRIVQKSASSERGPTESEPETPRKHGIPSGCDTSDHPQRRPKRPRNRGLWSRKSRTTPAFTVTVFPMAIGAKG